MKTKVDVILDLGTGEDGDTVKLIEICRLECLIRVAREEWTGFQVDSRNSDASFAELVIKGIIDH